MSWDHQGTRQPGEARCRKPCSREQWEQVFWSTLSSSPESLLANKGMKLERKKNQDYQLIIKDRCTHSFTRDTESPEISLVASFSDLSGDKREQGCTISLHSRSPGTWFYQRSGRDSLPPRYKSKNAPDLLDTERILTLENWHQAQDHNVDTERALTPDLKSPP